MSDRVVVWVLLDANGSVVTSSLYGEHLEAPAERWEASRIIRCVESSGASPDRESATWPYVLAFAHEMERKLAANRHKGDRDGWVKMPHGWLLTRVLAETAELASALDAEDGSARITSEAADLANFAMMIADVSGGLSLLGASPREDARKANAPARPEQTTASGVADSVYQFAEADPFPPRIVMDIRGERRGYVPECVGATEPAKEPDGGSQMAGEHPGKSDDVQAERANISQSGAAAPPVMDKAANEREVMPNEPAPDSSTRTSRANAVTGAAHPTNTPEAARKAPELCQVLPAGYVVTLNDGNGLNYRMGAQGRIVSYHATRWEAESAAFEAYGRAAWAHRDADAALLAEARELLCEWNGERARLIGEDPLTSRTDAFLARLGERP